MAILCVGWVQAQKTIYVSPSGGGNGQSEDSPIALAEAISSATRGTIIQLAEGSYKLSQALSLTDKSLSIVGSGKSNTVLQGSIELNASSSDILLSMRDLTIEGADNSSEHGIIGMIGTGPKKNKLSLTNCAINAASIVTAQTASVGIRMESSGAELTMTDTDIDVHYYGISIRNVKQKVTITNGTIIGLAAIMTSAGDLPDQKTDYSETSITVSGANLVGRAILNGFGQDYGTVVLQENYNYVTAKFNDCHITTSAIEGKDATQMSGLMIRSNSNRVTYTGGSISAANALNCQHTNYKNEDRYLHAALISLGYQDDPTVSGSNITISGTTMNHIDGSFDVFSYRTGDGKNNDHLTINNTLYAPKYGNILYGTTTADCSLLSRIANAIFGEKIILAAGTYELSSQLVIDKAITLAGEDMASTIIKATDADWETTEDSEKNLVSIEGSSSGFFKLYNLTIQDSKLNGLKVETTMYTYLENITLKNNAAAGMEVHSNVSEAKEFHTVNNGLGGVIIKGGNADQPAIFNFKSGTINEKYDKPQIWSELIDIEAWKLVSVRFGFWHVLKDTSEDGNQEMWFWTDKSLTRKYLSKSCGGSEKEDEVSVFANGYQVTVDEEDNKLIIRSEKGDTIQITKPTNATYYPVRLYGGGYEKVVGNSSITLNSGKLRNVYGGGRSDKADVQADVLNTATIHVTGTASAFLIVGGGRYYAKTNKVDINVGSESAAYTGEMGTIYVGAMDQGQTTNKQHPYEDDIYQNVNGIHEVTLDIYGGIFEEVACGGGNGYAHTVKSTVNIHDAVIGSLYGASANGRADYVTVNVFNTKITDELASVNRSRIGDLKMTFDKYCTFGEQIKTSLAAAQGWASSDTDGSVIPAMTGYVYYTFQGNNGPVMTVGPGMNTASVDLTGALAKMTKFDAGLPTNPVDEFKQFVTEYTIDRGKGWTFNNGLEMDNDIALINNGSLRVLGDCTVSTDAQLAVVLASNAHEISAINLAAGNYEGFTVSKNDITINGKKQATITGTVTVKGTDVTLREAKLLPSAETKNAISIEGYFSSLQASHNYWGNAPEFATLISGKTTPYPYYSDEEMTEEKMVQNIKIISGQEELSGLYDGCILEIKSTGMAVLKQENVIFESVTIEEGGQLKPDYQITSAASRAKKFIFKPNLENKWKALGTPFQATMMDDQDQAVELSNKDADKGIWFASLVEGKPEIEVKSTYTSAGLWAANDDEHYELHSTEDMVYLKNGSYEPVSGLQMCVNPNTYDIKLYEDVYVLSEDGQSFVLTETPTIKAFQSFVNADYNTKATLRSIGTTDPNATGNEFVVKEGYYLTTERGAIVVHTAEPMELYVVAVSGAVIYRGMVTDSQHIAVPTGIYAVNGQMVRVK